jgi:Xaa-Pro aminopeptidase
MPDVVIYADSFRTPELRHEVPIGIPDPFLYVERNGARHVVISSGEVPRLVDIGGFEVHPYENFGLDELRRSGMALDEILEEIVLRALRELGVQSAVVPAAFPLLLADRLRKSGIALAPDRRAFDDRRRSKSGPELAGIRRAQAAAEAGMSAARGLLRRASADADGGLVVGGEPLTSESVKVAISQAFVEHGASADDFIVSHGAQSAIGHHMGSGRLRVDETIIIDLWPRDNESSCYADMTRTFVVGEVSAEVAEWYRLCKESLDGALGTIAAGVSGRAVYDGVCDVFEASGQLTQRTKAPGQVLDSGFTSSLGHGVGLEVHEAPLLGMAGHEPLVAGDVVAVEPNLIRAGFGGLRLEDLVLVTDNGAENLTSFPYDLEP